MLLTMNTPEFAKYRVLDAAGNIIGYVCSFDTETEEIELGIPVFPADPDSKEPCILSQKVVQDGKETTAPILIKFKLPGAHVKLER